MASVNVDKQLFWDNVSGEAKMGYRDPATHVIVFDDAEGAPEPPVVDAIVEPERVEVEVDDERFAAAPEDGKK